MSCIRSSKSKAKSMKISSTLKKKYCKTKTSTTKKSSNKRKLRVSKSKSSSSSSDELLADKDGRFNCNDCGKSYKQISSLQRHIKKIHTMESTKCHQCKYCDSSFFSKYQLTVHKFRKILIKIDETIINRRRSLTL